jgi:hypothetical protein
VEDAVEDDVPDGDSYGGGAEDERLEDVGLLVIGLELESEMDEASEELAELERLEEVVLLMMELELELELEFVGGPAE